MGRAGDDLPGDTSPASWLGRALAIAGLLVAVLGPVIGVWVDAPRRRRHVLAVLTGAGAIAGGVMDQAGIKPNRGYNALYVYALP